jgi:type II secretion system protein H
VVQKHLHQHLHQKGFTLIELTVVLFLMGLFLFAALPNIQGFLFHSDLNSVARSLKATVRLLRSKSIVTGRNTILCLDLDQGRYWGEFDTPGKRDEWVNPASRSSVVSPQTLPEGIRFVDATTIRLPKRETGRVCSLFNPKGVIEETVLHLTDRGNRVLTIIINAYTGRFSLYREYVDVEYGAEDLPPSER